MTFKIGLFESVNLFTKTDGNNEICDLFSQSKKVD